MFQAKSKKKILQPNPGYLGFNISLQDAKGLLIILRKNKALGQVIPIKYRDNLPKIDLETAFIIAREFLIKEIQSEKYANLSFEEIKYSLPHSSLMYYSLACPVIEWISAGLHPGAIFVSVDKLDGHIWTDQEKKEINDLYSV